ncbi:riboflavin-specific deaminase C-terminal domain-containing protein [Roseomonas rosea]|uniref:Riboflavin-specific deaminase C-terminal domain-containing protein n=1 Tax=Muricoccus roseus TaxID=198092 RepID=A0A1M6KXF8_9PROT|nr:RibD family protein [Roseomonas rosea]SHJ63546.1 riboflavin-specific deaminase C-terminal domain-containing protein [Roseomonas rosea]
MECATDTAEDATKAWAALLARRAGHGGSLPGHPLGALFGPVLAGGAGEDGCMVIGRLAQTLDGRIATSGGSSQWIGGRGDILHTHRLRALCDAVLVGAGTVEQDDPRLTTREVEGASPVRVVLDPRRRLPVSHRVFSDGGPPTLLACLEEHADGTHHGAAELLPLPREGSGADLTALLRALHGRGLSRLFVEGGGVTVSAFLAAGLLDRLHVTIAPVILGSGRAAFTLPEATRIADGLRFEWTSYPLEGGDILLDIPLRRTRPRVCEGA